MAKIIRENLDRPLSAGQVAARSGVAVSTITFMRLRGWSKGGAAAAISDVTVGMFSGVLRSSRSLSDWGCRCQ